jgi:hypothetical protein
VLRETNLIFAPVKRFPLLLLFSFLTGAAFSQVVDSVPPSQPVQDTPPPVINRPIVTDPAPQRQEPSVIDSTYIKDSMLAAQWADSVTRRPKVEELWRMDSSRPFPEQVGANHPYFGFGSKPLVNRSDRKVYEGKELLFYALIALLLVFALLRNTFGKYFNDLFRLFFRTTLKQRQIRDQLMQTPLPSLLFNAFFIISAGLYADFLLLHFGLIGKSDFWLYFIYCCLGLSAIYFVKFMGLKVLGWLFNMKEGANSYIFVVFIMNKVIGIFLLPFVIMLAFMQGPSYSIALVLSWAGVGALLIYRFILTYAAVRNQVKFNPFHFFLYLCAFEIAPLLLIYKLLLVFFP